MSGFMIVGHRGAAGYEPENTLHSFRRAIEIGVDWIEMDVRRSADGHLVVIHDDTVDRTTGGHGKVSEMTLDELKKLDAGRGQKIPTLQEAIDFTKGQARLIIEIKQEGTEADVVDAIERNDIINAAMVASFFTRSIRRVKEISPRMMTAAIFSRLPIDFKALALDTGADSIFLRKDIVSQAIIEEAHKNGFTVNVWNEDNPEEIRKYAAMGPDMMSSNYPDRLKQAIQSAPAM
ncbi:MAG: cytoplasmic glycerophosphodiester phosphodiesterase [Methanocella sp. PtaU1.Bin125]|nr:MAG: cytoplasmic glycerophosphodiester phosphodiesterase [Methanocella sp. PtaU1.Bin125]